MEPRDTQLYVHRRLDTGAVFYVGIGKEGRAYHKKGRSSFWTRIAKKHGYEVVIVHPFLTWSEACELEIAMIAEFGRLDLGTGSLVNMTSGGEGTKDKSFEVRQKISKAKIGKLNPRFGKEDPQRRAVVISGTYYPSVLHASKELNLSRAAIRLRIRRNQKGCYYVND